MCFIQVAVIYLEFKIDKNSIFPVKENVDAIKNAKEPKNIPKLYSFPGFLNYYIDILKAFLILKKKLYCPFLWMGFNCLKAAATWRRR